MTPEIQPAAYRSLRDPARAAEFVRAVAEAEQASRRRRRIVVACAGAVAILLACSCSVVRLTMLPERQARAVVLAYFEALADPGSGWPIIEKVVASEVIADVPLVQRRNGTTQPAVRSQLSWSWTFSRSHCIRPGIGTHDRGPVQRPAGCYTPPTDLTVTDVTVGDYEAIVSVAYRLEGDSERHTASIRLQRSPGSGGALLARWQIVDAFGTLDLGPVGTECQFPENSRQAAKCVTVNGAPAPEIVGPGPRPTVLPGSHQVVVHLWNPTTGWQSAVSTAAVPPGGQATVEPAA